MVEIEDLNKTITHNKQTIKILSDINLSINTGEIFGIIGKSGAGKSTLIKCLNLLIQPDPGTKVIIDGVNLTNISAKELRLNRYKIGMIFQGFNLLNSKTVFDNVALPLKLQKQSKAKIKSKVEELLKLVGLIEVANSYPESLSGGQKQRVGIARALSTEPKLLLSDEATSALDTQTTDDILELLLTINKTLGLTIVLITHELDVIRKICDRVAVLHKGRIIELGKTVDMLLHPKQILTRKLILEEETSKYLEQVSSYYNFNKTKNNHLLILSFVGDKTFEPVLSSIVKETGIDFSILRGELGRIKHTPFGQLLLEIKGQEQQLANTLIVIKRMGVHYEIIY